MIDVFDNGFDNNLDFNPEIDVTLIEEDTNFSVPEDHIYINASFPETIVDPEAYPPLTTLADEEAIKKFYHIDLVKRSNPLKKELNKFNPEDAWIQTYSGRRVTPTNPIIDSIVIQDISHSLSMQCRFSGHVKKFYSVAQHSVLVSYICNMEDALWGLMHDASEAYLVDLPSPLKHSGKLDAYLEFENNMTKAICQRFNLSEKTPESVHKADKVLLATEARDLLSVHRSDWTNTMEPLPFKIEPLSQQDAKNLFMKRFFELTACGPNAYEHYLSCEHNE